MRNARSFLGPILCFVAAMLGTAQARAQDAASDDAGSSSPQSCSGTTAAGGQIVAIGSNGEPQRWIMKGGTAVNDTDNIRAENLNPWGINFADCVADMRLDFPVTIANFTGAAPAHLEVWAGNGVDCSVDANRYLNNAGVSQACWQVATATGTQVAGSSPISLTMSIYARNVLRYEQPPTQKSGGQPFDPNFHSSSGGTLICGTAQSDDAPVPLNLYFLAVNSAEHNVGQPACYVLGTDLVAPSAPPQLTVQSGDTLLSVYWTSPGNDPDLAGYDVWSDPPAGGAQNPSSAASCGCSIAPGAQPSEESDDTVTPFVADAADEAAADASADAVQDAIADALEAGGADATADAGDAAAGEGGTRSDAGDAGDAGGSQTDAAVCTDKNLTDFSSVVGNGGISQINAKYLADSFPGATPPSSSSPLTLTGMTNGRNYAVVVTSTDNYANVGPASSASCAVPQAVTDFWSTYAGDNHGVATCAADAPGGSGGNAALEALLLATGAALVGRRFRRARSTSR